MFTYKARNLGRKLKLKFSFSLLSAPIMYTSPPQGATLQPGFGSKPFSGATPIDLLLRYDLEPGQQVHEKTRLRSSFGFNTCRTLAQFFKRHRDHLSVAPASGQATVWSRLKVRRS
jgi:hypothetical protein